MGSIQLPERSSLLVSAFLVIACVWVVNILKLRRRSKGLPYPPGPPPKLLLGNAFDLPRGNAATAFAEWGKKLDSDIMHFTALGNHIIVINNQKIAEDLLDNSEKAGLYDDRPPFPCADKLGFEWNIGTLRYGDVWRQHRRVCQQNFNKQASLQYRAIQTKMMHNFIRGVLDEPKRWHEHNRMFSVSLTLSMMYGYHPKSLEDPVVTAGEEALILATKILAPGASILSIFPFLRHIPPWVPGASVQKLCAYVKHLNTEMQRIPLEHINKAMREGTAAPSLVTSFLERKYAGGTTAEEEAVINNIAYTVYGAASDTTISSTSTFVFCLVNHPHVVERAQKELDRVVGRDRLPDFGDRPSLPYIDAIYREVLRLHAPLQITPHALRDDDVYEGYFLPKGSLVLPNIWAMSRDERVYADPEAFKPERFLSSDGTLAEDSRIFAYGFGRRVCVGKHLASDTLFIVMASLLACFNFKKAKDDLGNDIEPIEIWEEYGGLSQLKAFQCSLEPRFDPSESRKLVDDAPA